MKFCFFFFSLFGRDNIVRVLCVSSMTRDIAFHRTVPGGGGEGMGEGRGRLTMGSHKVFRIMSPSLSLIVVLPLVLITRVIISIKRRGDCCAHN